MNDLDIFDTPINFDPATGEIIQDPMLEFTAEDYAKTLVNIQDRRESLKAMVKAWQAKIAKAEAREERVYTELERLVKLNGKLSRPELGFTAYIQKRESVVIEDESKIPEVYWRVKMDKTISKTDITQAIKAGQLVTGAKLEEKESLTFKRL